MRRRTPRAKAAAAKAAADHEGRGGQERGGPEGRGRQDTAAPAEGGRRDAAAQPSSTGSQESGQASWFARPGPDVRPPHPAGRHGRQRHQRRQRPHGHVQGHRPGPFVNGRIIDLDKATFATLASASQGVINVRIEW